MTAGDILIGAAGILQNQIPAKKCPQYLEDLFRSQGRKIFTELIGHYLSIVAS